MNCDKSCLKRRAMSFVLEQLKLRGEDACRCPTYLCNIMVKDIKIKVRQCKTLKRSAINQLHWEFKHLVHNDHRPDKLAIDYYVLVGFDKTGDNVIKMWLIPANDNILKRNTIIFIPKDDYNKYEPYEYEILAEQK